MRRTFRPLVPLLLVSSVALSAATASATPKQLVLEGTRAGSDAGESSANLYQLNLDRHRLRQLTHDDGSHSPEASPGGSRVVFSCGGFIPRRTEICIMNTDGSGRKQLTSNRVFDGEATWSPNGRQILFARYVPSARSNELFIMSARGTNVRRITNNKISESYPAWKPGSGRIAYVRVDRSPSERRTDIFTVSKNGSDRRRITRTAAEEAVLAWDSAAKRLAFIRDRHVFIKHVRRSGARRVTARRNSAWAPVWGPDGRSLIFERISGGPSPSGIVEVDTLSRHTHLLLRAPLKNGKCPQGVCYYTAPSL